MFAFLLCKKWLQSASLRVLRNVYNEHSRKSDNGEVLCHTGLYNHTDKYSHLCRAFLMVASVSEKLRCRLGTLDVSTFSRMECNELDFRRFDWWDPMSHGGSGRLKDRSVSSATRPLESSWSWVSADTVDLNKQWRACIKSKHVPHEWALINFSSKLWFTQINSGIILNKNDITWRKGSL